MDITEAERPRYRSDWREQLNEAFVKSRPIHAKIGNDTFEIKVAGRDCLLTKNGALAYSSTGTNSAYVLARFFILAKESMAGMFNEAGRSTIDRCVLESLLRDALEKGIVSGQDADKVKDVLSTVFWSESGEERSKLPLSSSSEEEKS